LWLQWYDVCSISTLRVVHAQQQQQELALKVLAGEYGSMFLMSSHYIACVYVVAALYNIMFYWPAVG
jgi:hypothetical protein